MAEEISFDLNTWKGIVSNKSKEEARKWFAEHFPHAKNHSLYKAIYKYPEELRPLLFMNENLNSGYLQEQYMDPKVRKVAFGSCVIHGPSGNAKFVITHCWLFNTDDIPDLFKQSNLYPNFDFQKLDFNKEEDREFVLDMFIKEKGEEVKGLEGPILSKEVYK